MPTSKSDVDSFVENATATRNAIGGVLWGIVMPLEVGFLRDFNQGGRYCRQSWIGQGLILLNLAATPFVWASGVPVSYPVLSLMMLWLSIMTILRFLLHRRWGRRVVQAGLRVVCTVLERTTSKLRWFPTTAVTGFIKLWSPPIPSNSSYYWGHAWIQHAVGLVLSVRQVEDPETGEVKGGMMPATWQLFIETPLVLLAGWMMVAVEVPVGVYLIVCAVGLAMLGQIRRSAILEYKADMEDQIADSEMEQELMRQLMLRRAREAAEEEEDDDRNIGRRA